MVTKSDAAVNPLRTKRSEAFQLLGEFHSIWESIEEYLFLIFECLFDEKRPDILREVFFSQTSHAARRKMVEVAAKVALKDDPERLKAFKNLLVRVKARADARHALTHGRWHSQHHATSGEFSIVRLAMGSNVLDAKIVATPQQIGQYTLDARDTSLALAQFALSLFIAKLHRSEPEGGVAPEIEEAFASLSRSIGDERELLKHGAKDRRDGEVVSD